MSIVQISRIQHRRGDDENIDKVLFQEGEIGFTQDTARLFIGAPNYDPTKTHKNKDPHNVEILTELTPVSELTKYQYQYRDTNHSEFPTSPSNRSSSDYQQYLQEKLDESVSIKSYGAKGDYDMNTNVGTDDTIAIRKAAIDVSNTDVNIPRALYFPAGIYRITRSAIIPSNSTWIGDGIGKTVIVMTDPDSHCVARTIPAISFSSVANWDHTSMNSYEIPELSQMFSNLGAATSRVENINIHGISFVYLGFEMNAITRQNPQEDLAVVKLEHSANVNVSNCSFEAGYVNITQVQYNAFVNGTTTIDPSRRTYWNNSPCPGWRSWQVSNMITTADPEFNKLSIQEKYTPKRDIIAVLIDSRSTGSTVPSENFNFIGCIFNNTMYGFNITDAVSNIVVDSCIFDEHYRAINIGENTATQNTNLTQDIGYAPKNIRVIYTKFSNIKDSAIYISNDLIDPQAETIHNGHGSNYNIFEHIGFGDNPSSNTVPAIVFENGVSGCSSIADNFDYTGIDTSLRVSYSFNDQNIIINTYDGSYIPGANSFPGTGSQVNTTDGLTIENNRTTWTDFIPPIEFNAGTQNCIIIEYSIKRTDERFRMGIIKIITTGLESGTNWTEEILETAPQQTLITDTPGVGVIFHILHDASGNTVKLQYKSSDLPNPGIGVFKYTSRFWDGLS
jgi:hypothetical protein